MMRCWAAGLGAFTASSSSRPGAAAAARLLPLVLRCALHSDIHEINREMAEFFGVPSPPDGTCIGPSLTPEQQHPLASAPWQGSQGASQAAAAPWPNPDPEPWHNEIAPAAAAADPDPHELELLLLQQKHQQQQQQQQQQQPAAASPAAVQQLRLCTAHMREQLEAMQQLLAQLEGGCVPPHPPEQQLQQPAVGSSGPAASSSKAQPQQQQPQQLTHVDGSGRASMVDVGGKGASSRVATASCRVLLGPVAFDLVKRNALAKGDVLTLAQVAGIQGAKQTSALIPLCHNIFLSRVDVTLRLLEQEAGVGITATAKTVGQTGVEMEALTAAAVAALTVYDMCKAASKDIVIDRLRLDLKEGGKSGTWQRQQ